MTISRAPEDGQAETGLSRRLHAVERRERELEQALAAVAAQQERLAAIRAEYETLREGLIERTREVQLERELLREERAKVVAESLARSDVALH